MRTSSSPLVAPPLFQRRSSYRVNMICSKCKQALPLKAFGPGRGKKDKSSWCKACKATYQREYKRLCALDPKWRDHRNIVARSSRLAWYGLTEEDYQGILALQGGVCAGCGRAPKDTRRLDVDHRHQPGDKKREPWERASMVRGLLCHLCNRALGILRDNPQTFRNLAMFLENPPAIPVILPRFQNIVKYLGDYEEGGGFFSLERQRKLSEQSPVISSKEPQV